nr:winged helix-turn-helix domain-containing protein [Aliivibrio fischeri]
MFFVNIHKRFYFDINNKIVLFNNGSFNLNNAEVGILELLLNNNRVSSKDEIFTFAWENSYRLNNSVVPQAISQLRKKFYRYNVEILITERSKGYRINKVYAYKYMHRSLYVKYKFKVKIALTHIKIMIDSNK